MSGVFKNLEKKYNIKYYMDNVVLISYPKSGRTWMRMFMAAFLDKKGYRSYEYESMPAFHYSEKELKSRYGTNLKVIFLERNPEDAVLSHYKEKSSSTRSGVPYHGSKSDFLRDSNYGLKKVIEFNNEWRESLGDFKDCINIRYEDMKNDMAFVMSTVLEFCNIEHTKEEVRSAVEYSSFENMQAIERGIGYNHLKHHKGNFGKSIGRVRQGKVGGYLEEFFKEDIDFIESTKEKMG